MPYLDFKELKKAVRIDAAAKALNLTMTTRGPQMRGSCPACQSGGDRALAINTDKASFYCFPARTGGDVISLVAHILGTSQKDAAGWLAEQFLNEREQVPSSEGTVPVGAAHPVIGMEPLAYLEHDHPAVDAVGFDPATAKALGIGYASKGIMRGFVAIPVRLDNGAIAGYIGIEDAKLPPKWHLDDNVVPFKQKTA